MFIIVTMKAMQLKAEIYRAMGVIADDQGLLRLTLKYLKKLALKKHDETLMTAGGARVITLNFF